MRKDCEGDYSEENSIFGELRCVREEGGAQLISRACPVLRVQFYAFEIARNRRGLNDAAWQKAQ